MTLRGLRGPRTARPRLLPSVCDGSRGGVPGEDPSFLGGLANEIANIARRARSWAACARGLEPARAYTTFPLILTGITAMGIVTYSGA